MARKQVRIPIHYIRPRYGIVSVHRVITNTLIPKLWPYKTICSQATFNRKEGTICFIYGLKLALLGQRGRIGIITKGESHD